MSNDNSTAAALTPGQERALDAIDHSARYVSNAPRGFGVAVRSLVARGVVRPVRESAYWPADFERVHTRASMSLVHVEVESDAETVAGALSTFRSLLGAQRSEGT